MKGINRRQTQGWQKKTLWENTCHLGKKNKKNHLDNLGFWSMWHQKSTCNWNPLIKSLYKSSHWADWRVPQWGESGRALSSSSSSRGGRLRHRCGSSSASQTLQLQRRRRERARTTLPWAFCRMSGVGNAAKWGSPWAVFGKANTRSNLSCCLVLHPHL